MPESSCQGLTREQIQFLRALFPADQALFQPEEVLIYGTDASKLFAFPWAMVRPKQKEQVQELLRWADQERVPIFPRARGTNVVGDCVPLSGGVVVSCLYLNKIKEIDDKDFVAVVEPGVGTYEFQEKLKLQGLFYPPDPASVKISSIGGNVSTNAGGLKAVKYGVTADYVLGLEAVLPGGEIIRTGSRSFKNVAGLDLTSLLVGSEGTLAFITEIILKILPLPEKQASLMFGFSSLEGALKAGDYILQSGFIPVALELMDEQVIKCLREYGALTDRNGTKALLLLQVDGSLQGVDRDINELEYIVKKSGFLWKEQGKDSQEEERLWDVRRMINPASFWLGSHKLSLDVSLPRGKVGQAVMNFQKIAEKIGLPVLTFGHLGDGNIHVNIMYNQNQENDHSKANQIAEEVLLRVLELRGTISGEHGIGLTKLPYLKKQIGEKEDSLMRSIKRVFDPHSILNPEKAY